MGVLTNMGRLLTKLGRCEEAVQQYKAIQTTSFYSQVGLALAHYSLNNYQQAYEAYESCLHWLADDDGIKSHILVAMGSLAYKKVLCSRLKVCRQLRHCCSSLAS